MLLLLFCVCCVLVLLLLLAFSFAYLLAAFVSVCLGMRSPISQRAPNIFDMPDNQYVCRICPETENGYRKRRKFGTGNQDIQKSEIPGAMKAGFMSGRSIATMGIINFHQAWIFFPNFVANIIISGSTMNTLKIIANFYRLRILLIPVYQN